MCLDFINTLDDRFTSEPKELLKTYIDLARFAEDTGILDPVQVDRLFARSQMTPQPAKKVLAMAIEMREVMYEVFSAIVHKKPVPRGPLFKLNDYVQRAAQRSHLVAVQSAPGKLRFEWRFDFLPLDFDAPLWPIARSAADLLASDDLEFVRACASSSCQWLFVDQSKNHRRRWCDMTKCGNRAKFRRFYNRNRKALGKKK